VSDPYEAPAKPELVVNTEGESPEQSAQAVVDKLEELGLLYGEVRV
jgi:adenylylsulfate kinase-like enzyme